MNNLKIDEINIIPVRTQNGLLAFSSAVINNLYIGNIAIYTSPASPDDFRLVYPTRPLSNGTQIPIAYPINREVGFAIQKRIVEEYLKLIKNLLKGDEKNGREQGSA